MKKFIRPEGEILTEQFQHCYEELNYAFDSPNQRLDLFLPERGGPFPLIVFVHGGGFVFGDKRSSVHASAFKLVSMGYAMATVEYRLATEARWPAQIYDVKAAIRFLRGHASEYGLKTEKILIWGNSAGGHLAQMAAATSGSKCLENLEMGYSEEDSRVTALISWYGVSDLLHQPEQLEAQYPGNPLPGSEQGADAEHSVVAKLLGYLPAENPEGAWKASPQAYVTADFPVSLFQHGDDDRIVPYVQSVDIVQKINEAAGEERAILELFEGGHGAASIKADENILRCLQFADMHFGIERDYENVSFPEIKTKEE